MEAFGCCPLCLADHQRIERLVYEDSDSRPPRSAVLIAPATGHDVGAQD